MLMDIKSRRLDRKAIAKVCIGMLYAFWVYILCVMFCLFPVLALLIT